MQVLNLTDPTDTGDEHVPWLVTNGASGNFKTTWYVTADEANMTLQLTATGLSSGLSAQWTFTDAATITAATGGSAISANTAGTTNWTKLAGPAIVENKNHDISTIGTIVLNAPAGFIFNSNAVVTITVTSTGSGNAVTLSNT
ncbi:MAG TPA: hypothetical protein VF437_08240, partial [Verrucomicrobiae bacterium]